MVAELAPELAEAPVEVEAEPLLPGVIDDAALAAGSSAVLAHALSQLQLIASLTVDATSQAMTVMENKGEEVSRVIEAQRGLEERFAALMAARASLHGMPNKNKLKENQDELQVVASDLRRTTQLLCRNLKVNPNVEDNLLKVQSERLTLQSLLATTCAEVAKGGYVSAEQMVQEELQTQRTREKMLQREQATTIAVRELKQLLKDEKEEAEKAVTEKKKELLALKEDLKLTKSHLGSELLFKEKEFGATADCRGRVFGQTLGGLQKQKEELLLQLQLERQAHSSSATFLGAKQKEMQEEVLRWMHRHETDTHDKDKELERLKLDHQRDLVRLKELEEKYQQELADREVRLAEERRQAELKLQQQADDEVRSRAAIRIQSLYRGWKTRFPEGSGKKGKKGKGKGKKKK